MTDTLTAHLDHLYGPKGVYPGNVPCKCEHASVGMGRIQGIDMGKGWVRTTTNPHCPHHGTKAQAYFKKHKHWPRGGDENGDKSG